MSDVKNLSPTAVLGEIKSVYEDILIGFNKHNIRGPLACLGQAQYDKHEKMINELIEKSRFLSERFDVLDVRNADDWMYRYGNGEISPYQTVLLICEKYRLLHNRETVLPVSELFSFQKRIDEGILKHLVITSYIALERMESNVEEEEQRRDKYKICREWLRYFKKNDDGSYPLLKCTNKRALNERIFQETYSDVIRFSPAFAYLGGYIPIRKDGNFFPIGETGKMNTYMKPYGRMAQLAYLLNQSFDPFYRDKDENTGLYLGQYYGIKGKSKSPNEIGSFYSHLYGTLNNISELCSRSKASNSEISNAMQTENVSRYMLEQVFGLHFIRSVVDFAQKKNFNLLDGVGEEHSLQTFSHLLSIPDIFNRTTYMELLYRDNQSFYFEDWEHPLTVSEEEEKRITHINNVIFHLTANFYPYLERMFFNALKKRYKDSTKDVLDGLIQSWDQLWPNDIFLKNTSISDLLEIKAISDKRKIGQKQDCLGCLMYYFSKDIRNETFFTKQYNLESVAYEEDNRLGKLITMRELEIERVRYLMKDMIDPAWVR